MNDPVSFPCIIRSMGGWPFRITFAQLSGHCSFDAEGCELYFPAGDKEAFTFEKLYRIRVVDQEHRGAFVDLYPTRRGTMFRVWIRGEQRTRESKAFLIYMRQVGE